MNERAPSGSTSEAGELARLGAIARVAIAKGWSHYAGRLGFAAAGALGVAWAAIALKSGEL